MRIAIECGYKDRNIKIAEAVAHRLGYETVKHFNGTGNQVLFGHALRLSETESADVRISLGVRRVTYLNMDSHDPNIVDSICNVASNLTGSSNGFI